MASGYGKYTALPGRHEFRKRCDPNDSGIKSLEYMDFVADHRFILETKNLAQPQARGWAKFFVSDMKR